MREPSTVRSMSNEILPGEVTPTLFVGLGGSGGRAVGRIAQHLRARADFGVRFDGLVRFLAIDTNEADLSRLRKGPGAIQSTVAISDFDKVEYSSLRRGEGFADADPYFTQWVHPWYRFREESGAGAGQIRIESRLGFNRAVEVGALASRLGEIVDALRHHGQGMRKADAPVQVFVYFSVAGGTGSGAFLPFAYILRDALADKRARVFGFAILPEAFEMVAGRNRDGVYANGYAALKELETLMKLDTNTAGSPKDITFHYDPRNKSRTKVTRRPFDLVYLVDRPQSFSLEEVGEALADASYVQIFSPILGDQQADFDNYTKESRALFPPELGSEGYTAFYGTLGASLVLLPRRDLLAYSARRYAATAVRRYLLLDDPSLVSDAQRERFKQFALDPETLDTLSPDERAARIDRAFLQRMELLASEDREGGVWKRILKVKETATNKLAAQLAAIETELKGKATSIREISADRILDGTWTPAATIGALAREVEKARGDVELKASTLVAQIDAGQLYAEFFKTAGPDGSPELSPYEQRYVLTNFREAGGPLAVTILDDLTRQIAGLEKECDLGREGRFSSELTSYAAELKRTHGGFDAIVLRHDKDFEATRERTVQTFNEQVERLRALLVRKSMHAIRASLGRSADALRASFRNIEASASRLSIELEEKARRFEFDGGALGGASEANDYTLDVEVLQHPSGKTRFWSWYYLDQIASLSSESESKDVLAAVETALRPRFDDRGRPLTRTAREIVVDIERGLIEVAERTLGKIILGDPKSDDPMARAGLTIDQALALEARYYQLHTERELERDQKRETQAELLRRTAPLSPTALWNDPVVEQYALRKLRAAISKSQPLTRFSPEAKSMIKHADMLLVGMHPALTRSAIGKAFDLATEGTSAQTLADWPDPDRIVFYRSVLGIPIYCFPHINEEMRACYERFQAQSEKAWPLHIDVHWEGLSNLDPERRRAELEAQSRESRRAVGTLALAISRGVVKSEAGILALTLPGGTTLSLARGPVSAAAALNKLAVDKPTVHEMVVAPLAQDLDAMAAEVRAELALGQKAWSERLVALEVAPRRSPDEESEYRELRDAVSVLKAL